MKHLFNFAPTVKFREGSSFMFKTILVLLWSIPVFLALHMAYNYSFYGGLKEYLAEFSEKVEKSHAEFQKKNQESRVNREEFIELSERSLAYFRALKGMSFSWNSLFEDFERLLPYEVRITRIRIKPSGVVKLVVDGEALKLENVTEFLRRLFADRRFEKPRLTQHSLSKNSSGEFLTFCLSVDYLPVRESRP